MCANGKTILFVDDDKDILGLANIFVAGVECNLLLADSGKKAIEIISENNSKIDLIFLDLMMPDIDGFDVLAYMKNANIKVPVIVQTGVICDKDLMRVKDLGAIDLIQKPYTPKHIKALLDKYVS